MVEAERRVNGRAAETTECDKRRTVEHCRATPREGGGEGWWDKNEKIFLVELKRFPRKGHRTGELKASPVSNLISLEKTKHTPLGDRLRTL